MARDYAYPYADYLGLRARVPYCESWYSSAMSENSWINLEAAERYEILATYARHAQEIAADPPAPPPPPPPPDGLGAW